MLLKNQPKSLKNQVRDPLFVGIMLLQLSMFGLISSQTRGGSLTLEQTSDTVIGAAISQGHQLPSIAAYDSTGQRRSIRSVHHFSTIILASSCNCESDQIQRWAQSAIHRGDSVAVVLSTKPTKLSSFSAHLPSKVHLLCIRTADFFSMSQTVGHTPFEVRVSPNGTVFGIQWM